MATPLTRADLANYPTKADLDTVVGAILEAINKLGRDLRSEMSAMRLDMSAMEARLMVELGRASTANAEDLRTHDEQYRDLPARVAALEARKRRR